MIFSLFCTVIDVNLIVEWQGRNQYNNFHREQKKIKESMFVEK